MAYKIDPKTGEIHVNGFQNGQAVTPLRGLGNLKNVEINTELGEIMVSYARQQQSQLNSPFNTGTVTQVNTNTVSFSGGPPPSTGSWITISGSTITGLSNGNYYVLNSGGKLSATFSKSSSDAVTGMGSGTATWTTVFAMSLPVAGASERYVDPTGTTQYRYYVLDQFGRLWVRDTFTLSGVPTPDWFLPFTGTITSYNGGTTTTANGMTVFNGWVFIFGGNKIFTISTSQLGTTPAQFSAGSMLSPASTTNPHYAIAGLGAQALYYTDANFIGKVYPDTTLITGVAVNVQSYASYTAVTTTGTITAILNGTYPTTATTGTPPRIPGFFFPEFGGTQPANLVAGTLYYIQYIPATFGTFEVYAAASGGSAIDIASGAAGVQYFNTFFPQSGDGNTVMTFTPQRLNLPDSEIATSMVEIGSLVMIGAQSNVIYPWGQVNRTPENLIFLPEAGTKTMLNVNNFAVIFAGNKANIYVSNGSVASLMLKVPDYAAGIPGNANSYVQPYFTWGGAMYLRGRVYFSILDQTSSKAGNCGGVWSFVPPQNFYIGQQEGLGLHMENKNSYGTFSGYCPVLIADFNQSMRQPNYYSAWISSTTSPTYGIDSSSSSPTTPGTFETDLMFTGTTLNRKTYSQIEYKLSAPLDDTFNPEGITMKYRLNPTDAYTALPVFIVDSYTPGGNLLANLSGYCNVNFQNTQWLQLEATLTTNNDATTSFVRVTDIFIR